MTIEAQVIARFAELFNDRMWFDAIPDNLTAAQREAPFCIVQEIGGKRRQFVDNSEPEFINARLQFATWGADRIQVSEAARMLSSVALASNSADFIVIIDSEPTADYNDVLKLRGSRQDIIVWYRNPRYVAP